MTCDVLSSPALSRLCGSVQSVADEGSAAGKHTFKRICSSWEQLLPLADGRKYCFRKE